MKKSLIIAFLAISLAGCASTQSKISTAWQIITQASVSPQQIIVAGNSFDAAEASATQFLLACKSGSLPPGFCALAIRKKIVSAVRSGRAARNSLEPYVVSGSAGPAALYDALVNSINTLQVTVPVPAQIEAPTPGAP